MYLTGGQFKGHKIEVPKNTRPTLSKVRESIFNMLFQYFENAGSFLDMFAGSGIMSLEAKSRGYNVTSLEINPKTVEIIKKNYKKIKQNGNIIITDAIKYKTNEKYDIIYIDPPWQYDYKIIIRNAKDLIKNNGIIIIEYDFERKIDIENLTNELNLNVIKNKKYGRTLIAFLTLI